MVFVTVLQIFFSCFEESSDELSTNPWKHWRLPATSQENQGAHPWSHEEDGSPVISFIVDSIICWMDFSFWAGKTPSYVMYNKKENFYPLPVLL